jgi:hypothetical protein
MTVSLSDRVETDETDKTYFVSNGAFLSAVFSDELGDTRPVVVSFVGNPTCASTSAWIGNAWHGNADGSSAGLPETANNYFSLAAFRSDEAGKFRRRKSQFQALHAIMLDDVGTKVKLERLTLAPSWLLETSPHNYQAGYLLRVPLTNAPIANRLMNTIIVGGLCDPGSTGPTSRLARLPVGVNGKHTPPFLCRMAKWSPAARYSVVELVDGLQLEMAASARPVRRNLRIAQSGSGMVDAVLIPRPEENAVLVALRESNLYKAPLGSGKHDVTCPWLLEHSGQVNSGTAYFEPGDSWAIGGFKCLHGHCANRHIRDLLRFLGVEVEAARMKSTIRVIPGEIHRVVDAAERELAQSGSHYQRGALIVTVVTDPGTRETRVQEISQPALLRALARVAAWERFDARAGDWNRIDPPARHTGVLFDAGSYDHLPVLGGLARQPYLRPDLSLMTVSGYDPSTLMFGVFNSNDFSVIDHPTRAQGESALSILNDLLTEFGFVSMTDRAAALAAILTATIRPSLDHAPMFHARAHMVGSGKSYLCELITAFATPQRGTPTTFPRDDEECRKLLLAGLLRAPAVIEFDNLTDDLVAHKSLCIALTAEYMSGRILGISKTATVSTRALFLSSGNNVGPVQDMARRCITINLDPGCEVPAARSFEQPELVGDVLRDRGRYVSATLTVIRAWLAAGKPRTTCKPLVGYVAWSDLCRQPLLWLGQADPAQSAFEAIAEDPDRECLGRLLVAWQAVFGHAPAMVRDALKDSLTFVYQEAHLKEALGDIAEERGEINRRKAGRWIKRNAGRVVDGRRFVRAAGTRSSEAWQVESVSSVSSVPTGLSTDCVHDNASTRDSYVRASRGH